ncbi:MAG: hypothetical protein WC915_04260 [archaeon]|jgi:hypothetical protein
MTDINLLGKNFALLWELHDDRNFLELEKTALKSLIHLGLDDKRSKKIAKHIKKAYEFHGEIDDLIFSKKTNVVNKQLVQEYKSKINYEMFQAFELFGCQRPKSLAKHNSCWWIDFSFTHISKNKLYYLLIIWHLFMLNFNMLNKLLPAITSTYHFCLAGIYGHNKRDKQVLIKELTKIWEIYLKYSTKPLIF